MFLIWGAVLAAPALARGGPDSFADLVEKLSPAVVNISTVQTVTTRQRSPFPPGSPFEEFFDEFFGQRGRDGQPIRRRLQSLGSGFIIDPSGLVVTNNHVVKDADQITVRTEDGQEYEADVVGRDPDVDVALLRIKADKPLPSLEWGDSDAARVGDWVLTIGNPFGLSGSVSAGIISAHHRDISGGPYDDFIQTDAAINRGNSGGPMFNVEG
ncbi:MAG: serine protease, partial [Alphaproteobacteria bacterium]